jgi:anti-anti-sigma factor
VAQRLDVKVEIRPDAFVVYVGGEVDRKSRDELHDRLVMTTRLVIVDLERVTFLGSSGISTLIGVHNRPRRGGW